VEAVLFIVAVTLFLRETSYGQQALGRLAPAGRGRSPARTADSFD
jgi:hypothetical protein